MKESANPTRATNAFTLKRDEELAAQAGADSVRSFTEIISRYEERLYNFLLHRCGNDADAEDLTQKSFIEAWRSIVRYNPKRRFSTWLYTIASRQAIHLYRDKKKAPLRDNDGRASHQTAPSASEPPRLLIRREAAENTWTIVDRELSAEQAMALWLRYVDEFQVKEIGRILGRSAVSVRVILHRARRVLRERLAEHDDEIPAPAEGAAVAPALACSSATGGN